jgi:hypothetical protein
MDSDMRVRLASAEEIKSVVLHPEFLPLLTEDGFSGEFEPDMAEIWLLFEDEGEIVGLFNFTHVTSICLEMHPMIFKQYRLKYARECMSWALQFFLETGKNKIIVQIPSDRPELVNFAKHHGFIEEGINRESVMKQGKIMNIIQLGITKREISSRKAA